MGDDRAVLLSPAQRDREAIGRRAVLAGAAASVAAVALGACSSGSSTTGSTTTTSEPGSTTSTTSTTSATPATGTPDAPLASESADLVAPYVPPADGGGVWETLDPTEVGWSAEGLDAVEELVGAVGTTTFAVVVGGRLVRERYFGSTTAETVRDLASCQKSVVSTLVGISVERGELELDQPVSDVLPAGWTRATAQEEARITVRHLLTMTSGLHPDLLTRVADPGSTFAYNTPAYQKLRLVLEGVVGEGIEALSRERLFDPIGMSPLGGWGPRPDRPRFRDATGSLAWGLRLSARDLARFGLLAQRLGTWGDTEVVSSAWFEEAWTSSPVQADYGYLWWLLGRQIRPQFEVPTDWVAALGADDQKVYVVPSMDLVVTRQGAAAKEATDARSAFDADFISALLTARA